MSKTVRLTKPKELKHWAEEWADNKGVESEPWGSEGVLYRFPACPYCKKDVRCFRLLYRHDTGETIAICNCKPDKENQVKVYSLEQLEMIFNG